MVGGRAHRSLQQSVRAHVHYHFYAYLCRVHLPQIPELRPKGMGLGANKSMVEKLKGNKKKGGKTSAETDEKLAMKVGAFARLSSGEYCRVRSMADYGNPNCRSTRWTRT